jgi:hypothetical protein
MDNDDVQGIGSLDKFADLLVRKNQAKKVETKRSTKDLEEPKKLVLTHTSSGYIQYAPAKLPEDDLLKETLN